MYLSSFFFQAEDGIRDKLVTGVQTCALPIYCDHPADGLGIDFGVLRLHAQFKAPGILDALERRVVLTGLALLESRARALDSRGPVAVGGEPVVAGRGSATLLQHCASIYGSAALGPPPNRGRRFLRALDNRLLSS